MKRVVSLGLFFLLIGCANDNAPGCLQAAGTIVKKEEHVAKFSKITVFEGVQLIIKKGANRKVLIETGEYLLDEVSVIVEEGRLLLKDNNSCNLFRAYGLTKVFVTTPILSEIRSSTELEITSDGILDFPNLLLYANDYGEGFEGYNNNGSYNLEVKSKSLSIITNGNSSFEIKGKTDNFNVSLAAGNSRVMAKDLIAENVKVFHRSSNDILVSPQQSLKGKLVSTGDVQSFYLPPVVEVEELYKGKVIFKN